MDLGDHGAHGGPAPLPAEEEHAQQFVIVIALPQKMEEKVVTRMGLLIRKLKIAIAELALVYKQFYLGAFGPMIIRNELV